jgi:hypothetical protein
VISARLIGDQQVLSRLRTMPDGIASGLARAIARLGIELQRRVQLEKLSGQVLTARTGALRSSINLETDQNAGRFSATVFADSGYAGPQEYGFSGIVNVRASLRRIREAFGRPIAEKTINVRAHSRNMHLGEHSFLRSTLEEMAPEIKDEVEAVLREAIV